MWNLNPLYPLAGGNTSVVASTNMSDLGVPKFIRDTTLTDVAKITVGAAGVFVAWRIASAIGEITDWATGKDQDPFIPNDTLLIRLKFSGRFPRKKKVEYNTFRELTKKKTREQFIPKIPYTRYGVATLSLPQVFFGQKQPTGPISTDWRCNIEPKEHFCDEALIAIGLEFPPGEGRTRERKDALLKVAGKWAQLVYGERGPVTASKILIGLRSQGGVPEFKTEEDNLGLLFEGA
jgi:hypothetical protein